ncbi:hypothetical protein QQF64_021030 [Cirrhinus molitorella]|uniref:BED-type domain-containing protein n=1 Tax=Cirrhinus molitorella TaxID=172907 RepID=A0ABR3LAU7_9TELE
MAANTGALLDRPQLVEKVDARSEIWHYFAYIADSQGKPTDITKPICKKCFNPTQAKGANTSNLAKHLADRHPDLYKEFKEKQANKQMPAESATRKMRQPSLPAVLEVHRKYDKDSKDAKRLNRAVAEFICIDQVPIYTVEKSGFRNLVQQLDRKYDMPGRNHFIYNEIPKLYTETRDFIQSQLAHQPFFACTTDIWTSRAVDAYMAVTIHYITESWETQSWCLGCSALYSDHTAVCVHEVLEEIVSEKWGLNLSKMSAITTDNASNNKKAFENYTWIPCFGHNLHLAVGKALALTRVSNVLSRLRTTVSAFSRSNNLMRKLKEKQNTLNLPVQKLVHDEPTRWNSTFEMVDRFCIQQQAVCAVLAENRKKWHLMPKDADIATLEIIREVLGPLSSFTDALSGEKDPTLSSVLPLKWKLLSFLTVKEGEGPLSSEMKEKIKTDFTARYESRPLDTVLNTATFLDPRFKDSFVAMEEEVKVVLLEKSAEVSQQQTSLVQASKQQQEEDQGRAKKRKEDLKSLLSTIKFEKSVVEAKGAEGGHSTSPADKLTGEILLYKQMTDISASEDPLTWWKNHETTMPTLAHLARGYLCIPASSCASERVFSTSGFICSPRRIRLTEEHIETLVFLAKNLKMVQELTKK